MKSTFSIIFYLKRQVVKKDGTVPVMGRITVDGTQAQFSCKTTANPNLWDTKGGRMIGKSMQALEVNRKLDKMRVSISKHYQEIMDRDNFVTADKVKNAFLGLEYRCHTLMKVYFQSRDEMEKQYKAGMKSLSTYTKYRIGCAYVGEFLQTHYHVKDIALKELSLPFITDYETFLRTDKHLKINSAMVFVRNLRAMVFRAIDNEWLVKDPFRRYEYKEEETTREFLSKEEIHLLMETPITRKKMSMVRDLFLFCCFTGLAFIDLYNLKEENIKEFFDEGEWIVIHRQKTGTEANIKLLDYPKQIMEKYRHLKINSAMVFVRNLRAMVFRAIDNEWLVKDPFRRYEYKEEETTREFLTKEEIRLLMEIPITRKKMSMVRDLFLFCCFTGLAFIDLYNLKEENIKTFFDDGEWIIIHRQKTGTEADIKLLDYPKQIMEKYRGLCEDGRVFPVPNYKSCMDSLKRLGKKCGITKPLSWHMSRHSFATSVCLSNGVPIETVSSMLGHKDIKTTQVYAKITKEKLSKDVEKLSQQINNIEEFTFGNVCNDNTNTINGRV